MPTLFTKIINREIAGRFVYEDDLCVAFLTVAPIRPGHTLVVPRAEVDHWVDLPPELTAHLFQVAQKVAVAIQKAFPCKKVGLMIAGLEVPHCHIHLTPVDAISDMDFAQQNAQTAAESLDAAAGAIRAAIGYSHNTNMQ
jgi:diadenosine tetraphosphate (Ap4A) HIT family hydrolase